MFLFEKGATVTNGELQCTEFIPKWYDGMSSLEFLQFEKALMHRENVYSEDVAPQTPKDCLFRVYYPTSVSDIVVGTLVFQISHSGIKKPLASFSFTVDPISRTRLEFISRNVFQWLLDTAKKPLNEANALLVQYAKGLVA